MFRQLHTLLVSIFVLTLSTVGFAQTAQIQGLVTDPSGAIIPKAQVRVVDQKTGTERQTETDSSGQYTVPALNPSLYKILVQAPGFSVSASNVITLNVAQSAVVNFNLHVGEISSQVIVNAGDISVDTTDATVSTIVDRQFVENIPLNGRTFQSLITMTPGVVTTATPAAGEQGQFSAAGQRPGSNYFTVDGVSANFAVAIAQYNAETANGGLPAYSALGTTASLVSLDALQEFRIESSTYNAEYGRESGAQVILDTRSGTNVFHGALFDYLRNDALDATDWFASNNGQPKPQERQNNFGGVFGGPILKDKTFFFFSYEGSRVTQPLFQISDVPSLDSRATAAPNVKAVIDSYSLPNGGATEPGMAQLATSAPNHATLDAASLRIDHAVNSKINLFLRGNYSPSQLSEAFAGFPSSNPWSSTQDIYTATLGATASLTPSITNEFRFNYSHARGGQRAGFDNFGGAVVPNPSDIWMPSQNQQTALQAYYIGNARNAELGLGLYGNNLNRQTNVIDSISMAHGAHLMKFGIDFRRMTPTERPPSSIGINYWSNVLNEISGAAPDEWGLLQDQSNVQQIYHNFSAFAQDTWKVSPALNLTYGIRWDYNPPPSEANGSANAPYVLSEVTDLSTATLLPRGTSLWHGEWRNFAPRVGLAYQLGSNKERPLVIRGGAGLYYDLGTDTAPFLNNGEGWFPYSIASLFCVFGSGTNCGDPYPYEGPAPPFLYTVDNEDSFRAFEPHLKVPYTLAWNVALEKTISTNQTLKATYVGAAGRRLLRDDLLSNPNQSTLQDFATIFLTKNIAYSNYDALELQFQRRLANGLQALLSYSWSHALDINSSNVAYENPYIPDTLYNVRQDYGNSDFDIRHSFSAALTYNIPTQGIGNPYARAVLRDWSINSNNTVRSGTPFNIQYTPQDPGAFNNGSGTNFEFRPNQVPNEPVWISNGSAPGGKELNIDAFAIPASLQQGTESRNNISGFSLFEMDLGIRRQFDIAERANLQFRADGFNVINHPNFGPPLTDLGTCAFGVPCTPTFGWGTSQAMMNQSLGSGNFHGTPLNALYQIGGPRSLQVSMKLQF